MKLFQLTLSSLLLVLTLSGIQAHAEEVGYEGDVYTSVDPITYEKVTTYIYGKSAEVIFNATAALARIENVGENLRRVVGHNLTCFEKFPDQGSTDPTTYTCKFIVNQGGEVVRPPLQ